MISARALSIIWGDHDRYWQWIAQPESRFSECAELIEVCWLAISKTIDSNVLTAHTAYAAYLVFKLEPNAHGLSNPVQTAKITVDGDTVSEHFVCLDVREGEPPYPWWGYDIEEIDDVILPSERQDGWWEVQLGEFYSGDGIDGEVGMSFAEIRGGHWKSGLIVEGIEVRPKNNSARKYNIIFDCDRLIVICKDYCRRLIV
ncbi:F-box family protein [Rhynchospora pubera]|uniref:F-box family protein n=1 Tax=Rhynchospora pubera TaxID=906938 RepID=A0AAV8E5M5_9POAL|nr:F-box family protein [Rhynchospora pubera]